MHVFISNDCVNARIYQILNRQFDNPFIWTRLSYFDFSYLIRHYDDKTIDFTNVKIQDGKTNILNIDNKIYPFYRHYVQDNKYKIPTQMKGNASLDIHYYKIKEYCIQKYKTRLQRFLKIKYLPIFVLNHKSTLSEFGYGITDNDCLDFLELDIPYEKILVTTNKNFINKKYKNTQIIYKNSENTCDIAKKIIKVIDNENKALHNNKNEF
jgi:hypothetical protein